MAVEGEANLWKPSASSSLWDARRLPSLPDLGPALNKSSSFEYDSPAAGKAQEPPAGKNDGARGKASVVAKQDLSLESASTSMTSAGVADGDELMHAVSCTYARKIGHLMAAAPPTLQATSEQLASFMGHIKLASMQG